MTRIVVTISKTRSDRLQEFVACGLVRVLLPLLLPALLLAQEPSSGLKPQEGVPRTAAAARKAALAVKQKLTVQKQDETKDPPLQEALARQLKALEGLQTALLQAEGLESTVNRIQQKQKTFEQELASLQKQGVPSVSWRDTSAKGLEKHQALLAELKQQQATEIQNRQADEKTRDNLPAELAAAEKAFAQAEKDLREGRQRLGVSTGAAESAQLEALVLERAHVSARLDLVKAQEKRGLVAARIAAEEARSRLLETQIAYKIRFLRDLQRQIKSLASGTLQGLEVQLREALTQEEKADPAAKPYWHLKAEVLRLQIAKLKDEGQLADWGARLSTGSLGNAIEDSRRLKDDLQAGEDDGRSLKDLRALEQREAAQLEAAPSALDRLLEVRQQVTRTQRDVTGQRSSLFVDLKQKREAAQAAARKRFAANPALIDLPEGLVAGWDTLQTELGKALKERRDTLLGLRKELDLVRDTMREHEALLEENLAALQRRILWTQGENHITLSALTRAMGDLKHLDRGFQAVVGTWGEEARDLVTREDMRSRAFLAGALTLLWLLLFLVGRRFMPRTFSWIEDQRRGPKGRVSRLLATVLRKTGIAFAVMLVAVGIPWVVGAVPRSLGTLAIVFVSPFTFRFLRVLLDMLLDPTSAEQRLMQVDDDLAALLHRAGRYLLGLSLVFIPLGLLLEQGGYTHQNPGLVELWWLAFRTLVLVVMMFSIFRPGVILRFVTTESALARSAVGLFILAYPVFVLGLVAVFLLFSLNYDVAAQTFTLAGLKSVGLLLLAWVVYRWALRSARPGQSWAEDPSREAFDTEQDFLTAGRELSMARLTRLVLRVLFFAPALLIARGYWPALTWEFLNDSLAGDVLTAALALGITLVLHQHLRAIMRFVLMPRSSLDAGVQYTLRTLISYAVLAVGAIVVLQILQVDGQQIAVVTGALMVGIGFGLQSVVKNLVSGIILLVERPVKVGDWVEVGDKSGQVEKITIRATTVMTWDGVGVVIPNEHLISGTLVNASLGHPRLRRQVTVGVAYGSDVGEVKKLLLEATRGHGLVLKRPSPEVFFVGFGDSSLDFMVRFWTSMNASGVRVKSDLRQAIEATFARHQIEIPFPQRDLNVRRLDQATGPEPDVVPEQSPGSQAEPEPQTSLKGARKSQ